MSPSICNLVFLMQDTSYSTPVDMWSLGAVMSYYCNKKHLFRDCPSVQRWAGGRSTLDRKKYSLGLRQLIAELLSPTASLRPTATKVNLECHKDGRQKS